MKPISSRQNPTVRAFRELADAPDAAGARLLLDGAHLVHAARDAGLTFEAVAVAAGRLVDDTEEGELARALDDEGAQVFNVTTAAFAAMSPVRSPSGIVAIVHRRPTDAKAICGTAGGFILVAIGIQDPGNLGSLIRTAEAGGVTGVVVAGGSASPFSWKAVRGSMGSILRLPVATGLEADTILRCARALGTRAVASVPAGGRLPDDIDWTGSAALVLGGEGLGIPLDIVDQCDDQVTIPMAPAVESLNVAVAGGILIYAARRQRVPGEDRTP
jgi:TrmH family RNA methyltransferase